MGIAHLLLELEQVGIDNWPVLHDVLVFHQFHAGFVLAEITMMTIVDAGLYISKRGVYNFTASESFIPFWLLTS